MAEYKCYEMLHGGEGPRGDSVEILHVADRLEAAEEAAEYFDDIEIRNNRCGQDEFDGAVNFVQVVGRDGHATTHEVVCEVKRIYTAVIR